EHRLGANESGTNHAPCSPPSHPGRVLLRVGGGFGFVVGAPPRCERGRHAFAPGAGAPTVRRWDWLCCRSTAPVRTGAGTNPPHPHLAVHHITTPPSSPLLLPR